MEHPEVRTISGTKFVHKPTESDLYLCTQHGYLMKGTVIGWLVGDKVVQGCKRCWESQHSFPQEAPEVEPVKPASLRILECAHDYCKRKVLPWEKAVNTCFKCEKVFCRDHLANPQLCTDCADASWLEGTTEEDDDVPQCNHPGCRISEIDRTIVLSWCVECEMYYCDEHAAVKLDCCANCEKAVTGDNGGS